MKLKKWAAAVLGSGMIGMAGSMGVIGLIVIGVTGYNIIMEPDQVIEDEEDIAKVHRLGYGECECNCIYIGDAGNNESNGNGVGGSGGSGGTGSITFTGTEDKTNFVNSAFYFTKLVSDELGVAMWVPYAINSGETAGSIYQGKIKWNPSTFTGLDANVTTSYMERTSLDKGAAGFFQVEGVSVASESGFIMKDLPKYEAIMVKAGLDASKYPGMQANLKKEISLGYTNWYQDCTYYPAAIMNHMETIKENKQKVASSGWLDKYSWYTSASQNEKDFVEYCAAMSLWNNGNNIISNYKSNDLFAKYLEALLDVMKNKFSDFQNLVVNSHTTSNGGNGAYTATTEKVLTTTRWVLDNSSVITDADKAAFDAEFKKSGSSGYKQVLVRRFTCYITNELYNTFSRNGEASVLRGLEANGITITGGWNPLSDGNNSNLGNNRDDSSGKIYIGDNAPKLDQETINRGHEKTYNGGKTSNNSTESSDKNYIGNKNNITFTKEDLDRLHKLPNNTVKNSSEQNTGGTGNLGSSDANSSLGKYIDDKELNPLGMPLYDGYTFDPSKYEYRDTDYSQFWNGNTPSSDVLYGLGDFTDLNNKNEITYEGGSSIKGCQEIERKQEGYALADGRIPFAVAPAIGARDEDLALLQSIVTDASKYAKPSWPDPPVLNKNGNVGNYTGANSWGLYFDIVLDNGTVVPCMIGDTKAMHLGEFGGIYHDDRLSQGYCQLKYKMDKTTLGYKTIIETCYGNSNDTFKTTLFKNRKIVSVRTYWIQYSAANNWQKYFKDGGSSSSFGLTGGSSTGNASIGGTGGGSTTTTTGLNPNDPNWRCACNIPCSKCMCHDEGVGGRPVGSDGNTIGSSTTGINATLQQTTGLPQGLYCDLSGNQLSPEQVWQMFEEVNPTAASTYKPTIGNEPVFKDITVNDTFVGKFNDNIGTIHYVQFANHGEPYGSFKMKLNERYTDGFSNASAKKSNGQMAYDSSVVFGGSGCGWTGCAIIASTMLHKYITPTEVIMASYLSPKINPEFKEGAFLGMFAGIGAGAQVYTKNDAFWNTLRYGGERLFNISHASTLNRDTINSTLDAGGMVLYVVGPSDFTSGGHYITIRSKQDIEGGTVYYTADGSKTAGTSGDPNNPRTFEYLKSITRGGDNGQITYVTPGPGYAAYIKDLGNSSNGSNVGGTGNLGNNTLNTDDITVTEHLLGNSSRHLDDIWRDQSGNIPLDAKVYVFTPKNSNGHSVTIDAGHGNNSHPATSLPTESVYPGLSASQIKSMGSDATGKDTGVESRDFRNAYDGIETEPECTLAVALKVRDKLLAQGYTVTMTRNTSTQNISNGTRAVLGCEISEIYVAIHTNASDSHTARGVISFYPDDSNNGGGNRTGYTRMLGLDSNKANSKRLAQELSNGVKNSTPGLSLNGSGTAGHVLRIFSYSNKPIALIELAFSDQYNDAKILIENKEEMAQGIVDGINSYFGY